MNTKFSTYAYPYIVGEISSYVRENKNIKVSRDMVRLGKKIKEYIDKHYEVRGYKPTIKDIALMLNTKEDKIICALNSLNSVKSIDEEINKEGKAITLQDITPMKESVSKEDLIDLKDAFKYLSDDEKRLLIYRYYNDYTQKMTADTLGVNQVYVSRMEKKALTKMKTMMKTHT